MRHRINDGDKILIIKLGSIGDVVHTLPCLAALRAEFPGSYIGWLIEQRSSDLIKDHPLLDKAFIFQRKIRHVWPTIKQIRQEQFQWAIDFQGTYKSQFLSLLSGAHYRVGYGISIVMLSNVWLEKFQEMVFSTVVPPLR